MSRGTELAKNTTILLLGRISTRAVSFFLLPLYTAYLTKAEYGVVDLVSTIIVLLCPVVTLSLEQAIFRFIIPQRNNKEQIKIILSTSVISVFGLIAIYSVLFFAVSPLVNNEYKWFLLMNVIVTAILSLLQQALRGLGDNTAYALSSFLSSIAVICFNILLIVFMNMGAKGMLWGIFLGNLIGCGYCVCASRIWRFIHYRIFNKGTLREMIAYSLPLIPNELSWWAIRCSDRIIITAFIGLSGTGLISIGHKFPEIYMTLYSVFGLAWTESIVLHIKERDGVEYFSRMSNQMFKFFSSLCILIISAIPLVFPIFVNKNFAEAYPLIPIYFIGTLINVAIGIISVIYIANNRTMAIAKTSFYGGCIAIISCIVLVKFIGVYASPLSFILGYGIMLIYRCVDIQRFIKFCWDVRYIVYLLASILCICVLYYSSSLFLHIIGLCFALLFCWAFNRDMIRVGITEILKKYRG